MEDLEDFDTVENISNQSPTEIAQYIFSRDASPTNSRRLDISENPEEDLDMSYVLEILISILLEGLEIFTKGLKTVDLTNFTSENISALSPWFRSLGFKLNVQNYITDIENEYAYNEYYCKVVLNRGHDAPLFTINNVDNKSYHFLLNGDCLTENRAKVNLKDLYAIFINNDNVFVISFDFLLE